MTRDLRKELDKEARKYLSDADVYLEMARIAQEEGDDEKSKQYKRIAYESIKTATQIRKDYIEIENSERESVNTAVKVGGLILSAVGIGVAIWEFKVLRKIELNNCLPEKKGMEELMKMSMKNLM